MAWYYGTYSCGHEGRTNIVGKGSERQGKADWIFSNSCEECRKVEREREREIKLQEAKKNAENYPDLIGSEKQVAWALTLRDNLIKYLKDGSIFGYKIKEDDNEIIEYLTKNKTSAKWWIDKRLESGINIIREIKSEILEIEEKQEIEVVHPENIKKDDHVYIDYVENTVIAKYKYDVEFIALIKEMSYVFNAEDKSWRLEVNEFNKTKEDRMAELGNFLLINGFAVSIKDKNIRENSINGTFKKEHKNWIKLRTFGKHKGMLVICGDVPEPKITGIKDNVVSIVNHKEIEDFAEYNNFKFSKSAKSKIDEYKNRKIVKAKKNESSEIETKNVLNILNNCEVIDDLKD